MTENTIHINKDICIDCRYCTAICPHVIFKWNGIGRIETRPERVELCFKCGQCMAVCSSGAIQVEGLSYEKDFISLPETDSYENQFFDLLISRRAVRSFKDRPVSRELLEKVVNGIKFASPGFTPIKTELTVVIDREVLKKALPLMIEFYDNLLKMMGKPINSFFIR